MAKKTRNTRKTLKPQVPKPLIRWGSQMEPWRRYRKITQVELVDRLARRDPPVIITRASISRYENGKQVPPADILQAIAKVLNTTTDALLNHPPGKERERLLEALRDALTEQ